MKFFTCVLILLFSTGSFAQMRTVSGKVVDEAGVGIPFANAALYANIDSTLVTGAVSDAEGFFSIQAPAGNYYLKISFLSYQEKTVPRVNLTSKDLALGNITLAPSSQMLEEITVQGEQSTMELYLDKRIFNVGKDLSNISGSASDILDNVPSVTVDIDGNVALRGSQNVRILIDGKPSGLTGISTADALQQLQANLIESVEVITNPSARYDAEGEVGIINIKLKKESQKGVHGAFNVNTGYPANHGASFNMNWRRSKINLFSSYGFNYRNRPGSGQSFQEFTQADTSFAYQQFNRRSRGGTSHNIRAGLDYFIDQKNILTGSVLLRTSDGLNTSNYEYLDLDETGAVNRRVLRNEREEEPEFNSEIALSYRREYAKKDKVFSADFKWIENVETERANFDQVDLSNDSTLIQRSSNTENERNLLAQVDYVNPFGKKGRWETGARSTMRVLNNDFLVEQQDADGTWNPFQNFNNNLVYTENIHAFYGMVGNEINRFAYQAGVRGELSDIKVELLNTGEENKQFYFNLFPSVHFSYKIKPEKTLQLSYSYRISRPRFRELIPFSGYSDARSQWRGNPNLRPEYTHSIEAGYLLNWGSGSILSSAYYRYRTGVVERITVPVEDPGDATQLLTETFPVNLANEDAYGFEFNFSWDPTDWWRFNTNANFYRAITQGEYEGQRLFSDTYTWTSRATSNIKLFKTWDFQTGVRYRAPRITPQGRTKSIYSIDLGLSRDMLNRNATVTLGVRDLLNSRKRRSITQTTGYYSESEFQWRARQITLTFTYRLNQRKREQGNQDEYDEDQPDFSP